FSMFNDLPPAWGANLLVGVTIGIAMAIVFWWWRERHMPGLTSWALLLVLTGAVGNIWDRLTFGYVVDFIDWYVRLNGQEYHWPAFNVADSCISIGVVFLLLSSFKKR
ncbi:MAG: signal peptidase II, partial [Mariprofundaceae bacterium]